MRINISKQDRDSISSLRKILVEGDSMQDIDAAIKEINFQRVSIDIDNEHVDHVCGVNDSNLDFMASKSGVITLTVDKNTDKNCYSLVAIGLQQQIDDLRIIFESHMTYLEQFNAVK